MQEVTVRKEELLAQLKENREKHKAEFAEALKGYRKKLTKALDAKQAELNKGLAPEATINLPKPYSHTHQYDQIIKMVEMSVEDSIKLFSNEFAQYVMDNWSWKQTFTSTNMMYTDA